LLGRVLTAGPVRNAVAKWEFALYGAGCRRVEQAMGGLYCRAQRGMRGEVDTLAYDAAKKHEVHTRREVHLLVNRRLP
jgi:hypothetical protein